MLFRDVIHTLAAASGGTPPRLSGFVGMDPPPSFTSRSTSLIGEVIKKTREELKWTSLDIERDESDVVETIKAQVQVEAAALDRGLQRSFSFASSAASSTKFTPPPVGGSAGEAGEGGLAPPRHAHRRRPPHPQSPHERGKGRPSACSSSRGARA